MSASSDFKSVFGLFLGCYFWGLNEVMHSLCARK